jgi:restriction endonuclease Mrr
VEVVPEEEDKTAKVLERIRENAPKVDIRYESSKPKVEENWEKPKVPEAPMPLGDIHRAKEMSSMPLAQFQDLVVGLLSKLSFAVQKVKKVPGGTVQILADYDHPVIGGNFMVLARQYPEGSQVHADLVKELDEITREEACKRGIYVVTGAFTEEARNVSRKMAVDLVDGKTLSGLLDGPSYDGRWSFRVVDEKGVVVDLSRMALLNFEQEVDQFLKSLGFQVVKIRRAPGGSVVAVVEHRHPVTGGKFAVLAKQFPPETQVPAEQVSEFAHIMQAEFCHRGILMATAGFSMEARALSRFSGVELVDGNTWENLRRRMGGGA